MKTLYYNAIFNTMSDPAKAGALVVEDGRILVVGGEGELRSLHPDAENHDLGGGHAFPGFIDTYSAAGIDAYVDYCRQDRPSEEEVLQWVTDAWDFLLDKGVSRLLVHCRDFSENPLLTASESLEIPDSSFICDPSFKGQWEEALYPGSFDAIADSPLETHLLFDWVYNDAEGVRAVIRNLTVNAAQQLGLADSLGTLEVGKQADMVVFEKNPLELPAGSLPWLHAALVIHRGQVIYNAADQAQEELYDLLMQQPF